MASAGEIVRAGDHPTELGYAEVTANQTGIIADTDLTGLTVTVDVPAGRTIKIHGHIHVLPAVVTTRWILFLKEDGTIIATGRGQAGNSAQSVMQDVWRRKAPTTGSHTYKLSLQGVIAGGGAGTVDMQADSGTTFGPAFIEVNLVDA